MKLLLAATLCISSLAAKQVSTDSLEKTVQETLAFWHLPGCAVAVVHNDHILITKGYGKKRYGFKDTIDAHTLFPIASIAKTFTAAAIGKLVHSGFCSYDDRVLNYFPPMILAAPYATDHITLGDCLSMSTGLSSDPKDTPNPQLSTKELLEQKLPNVPLPKGFRGMWAYQNYNFLLAATVFESTPQKSWQSYLSSEILLPRKMTDTLTNYASFQKAPNKASAHQWTGDKWIEIPYENLDSIAPAAGLYSSAYDMALWLRAITPSLLPMSATFTSHVVATREGFFPPNELYLADIFFPNCQFLTYGYGWFIHDYQGIKIYHTPGLTDGFTPAIAYIPSLSLGIAVLPNAESTAFTHALLYQLIDLYLDTRKDWNTTFLNILDAHGQHPSH